MIYSKKFYREIIKQFIYIFLKQNIKIMLTIIIIVLIAGSIYTLYNYYFRI